MAQTIEINGRTLFKLLAVLLVVGGLIFFLNRYDRNKKADVLKEKIEFIENSYIFEEIKELVTGEDTSMTDNFMYKIKGELMNLGSEMSEKNAYNRSYYDFGTLIFYKEGHYFESKNRRYNSSSQSDLFKEIFPSEKEKYAMKSLKIDDEDAFSILANMNRGERRKVIMLPLSFGEGGDWYLKTNYYDKS